MKKYPVKTYPVDKKKVKALAPRYPRYIRWSDEDKCFIGSLPNLCGDCCHGDTPEEVARELTISAELSLEASAKFGFPFPEPRSVIVTPSEYRDSPQNEQIPCHSPRRNIKPKKDTPMKNAITPKIQAIARQYPRIIRWSNEDNCYIGSLPDLDGDCTHGDTPDEVAQNLDECAEIYVADCLDDGTPLPEPSSFIVSPS